MRIILAGCGFIAREHLEALKKTGHEVVCVSGRSEEGARRFACEHGIGAWTADIEEALAVDADAVHICTPPDQHEDIIRKSLAAGKHVICEKPLCIDPEAASELAAEAEEAYQNRGLVTALCLNVRYYPALQEAADMIRSGKFGRVLIISGSYRQEYHVPPRTDGWRFDDERSGGQRAISEIGTHWIDLAAALTGCRIRSVSAALGNWYPVMYRRNGMLEAEPPGETVKISSEDAAAASMEFDNGAIGTLLLSEVSKGHSNDLVIEIAGTRGSVRWEEKHPDRLLISEDSEMAVKTTVSCSRSDTFCRLFSEVYMSIEEKMPGTFPTFSDGVYIARVCDAIRMSGLGHCVRISSI